ncbi:hypothetical protein C8Q78DRAFT_552411 [Trametes maxima]|nr:hypothetical protein C8Q78DRAFT_552411 [Trametes maxima]
MPADFIPLRTAAPHQRSVVCWSLSRTRSQLPAQTSTANVLHSAICKSPPRMSTQGSAVLLTRALHQDGNADAWLRSPVAGDRSWPATPLQQRENTSLGPGPDPNPFAFSSSLAPADLAFAHEVTTPNDIEDSPAANQLYGASETISAVPPTVLPNAEPMSSAQQTLDLSMYRRIAEDQGLQGDQVEKALEIAMVRMFKTRPCCRARSCKCTR